MGLKTAGWWLGDIIKIETTYLGEAIRRTVIMNCNDVAKGKTDFKTKEEKCGENEHYTKIEVTKLDKAFLGNRLKKIKNILRSMYNREMLNNNLTMYWDDKILEPLTFKLHKNIAGEVQK